MCYGHFSFRTRAREELAVLSEGDVQVRRPRGRPRPQETIARDAEVLRVIEELGGSATKRAVVDALGVDLGLAYLSLIRLRRAGRIERVPGGNPTRPVWRIVG